MLNLPMPSSRLLSTRCTGWVTVRITRATAIGITRNEEAVKRRACSIEEVTNGYVVRLYEPENGTLHNGDSEWFIERTLASVEKRIENHFLLSHFME